MTPVSFSWHEDFGILMDVCITYARQWAKKGEGNTRHFLSGLSRSVVYTESDDYKAILRL